jgi:hypothetical protein
MLIIFMGWHQLLFHGIGFTHLGFHHGVSTSDSLRQEATYFASILAWS